MRLAGKTALITGGASGFGAAIAACFIAEGAHVAIMDMNAPATQDMAGNLGNDCIGIVGDVTKSCNIQRATQTARNLGDALDIVVNNAGWTHVNKPMLDVKEAEFDRLYDINVKSMAVELAPDNIRVNCVAPVMGATGLLEAFMGLPDTPENRGKFIASIPIGRLSDSTDIAKACLYLASDDATFITGVVLEVDGGRTI